jgi:hypothetical protein
MPQLLRACEFYVGYSHHRNLTPEHPLVVAIAALEKVYEQHIHSANMLHDPELFHIPDTLFQTPTQYWGYPEPIDTQAPTGMDDAHNP